jgi:hypothetical protein
MTELVFKNKPDDMQMSILLHLLKSWKIEAEFLQKTATESGENKKNLSAESLPFSAGMWSDYDIDDKTLRAKAWGTEKRAANV